MPGKELVKIIILNCLLITACVIFIAGTSKESWAKIEQTADQDKEDLQKQSYRTGYADGYRDAFRAGYQEGHKDGYKLGIQEAAKKN